MSELQVKATPDGKVIRVEDGKLLATIDQDGAVKYANPAYAKDAYKEAIEAAVAAINHDKPAGGGAGPGAAGGESGGSDDGDDELEVRDADPRVPVEPPPRHPTLGSFSAAWMNYDHEHATDEEFAKKYSPCAEAQLEFIARRPHLFADLEGLEERLGKLNK